jgi:hypothetical protein
VDITGIDKNFSVPTEIDRTGLCFYDVEQAPFRVYGTKMVDGCYRRMPESVATATNNGVREMHTHTAGARVRFVTDSPRIAIRVLIDGFMLQPRTSVCGSASLDVYVNGEYCNTFIPPHDPLAVQNGYESVIDTHLTKKAEILLHFPLFSSVTRLFVGLEEGSVLEPAAEYTITKPVVCYGSSITHGACASRPGNCYENILSRTLDCDFLNLGFSGSACGEDAIAHHIATLEMSAFVYDYDHNAPTPAYLAETHERMFKRIRAVHPDLPILMLSRPQPNLWNPDDAARLEIVRRTYENALAAGDQNVYFITGQDLMADVKNEGLVDGVHPNDAGFVSMARAMLPVLKKMLSLS